QVGSQAQIFSRWTSRNWRSGVAPPDSTSYHLCPFPAPFYNSRSFHQAGVPADVADGSSRGDTPLHWAASGGHVNICSILLEKGAVLNACNSEGATALHEASKSGHLSVVSLLLGLGANPHMVGTGGV
ncbi:unnamed protein product, partial [Hapterophycus canaliculatus]